MSTISKAVPGGFPNRRSVRAYSSNKLFTIYVWHKKSRYTTAVVCAFDIVDAAKVGKVFGMCKGDGRKCVAEHVFCGKRKGSRVGEGLSTPVEDKF